jgi:hypothetical protein
MMMRASPLAKALIFADFKLMHVRDRERELPR